MVGAPFVFAALFTTAGALRDILLGDSVSGSAPAATAAGAAAAAVCMPHCNLSESRMFAFTFWIAPGSYTRFYGLWQHSFRLHVLARLCSIRGRSVITVYVRLTTREGGGV